VRKQNSIIRILILVFAALIAIVLIGGGIYLFSAYKSLKSIALVPDFSETSLEVGTQYTFSIETTPKSASLKKAKCVVDDPTSSFEISDAGKAVLTTGMNEGNVTVYVECKDIKSQVLTFAVVDSVARAQAEAAAQAEAQKQAEEEKAAEEAAAAAEEVKKYVKSTGDDVNIRSTNSTDGDVLGKAKKGDMFEKVEDVEDWTHIKYKDQDGYMKTEFLAEISEEEFQQGPTEEDKKEDDKKDEKKEEKKEEKKQEDKPAEESPESQENNTQIQSKEEAEAKAAEDAAKAAEEAAKAAADAEAAQQALAAAAAAGGHSYGGHTFTNDEWNCLLSVWAYTGDAEEMITHHSAGELKAVLDEKMTGGLRSAW